MSRMLRSIGAMGAATLASRVLGMIREMVYAGFMGASPEASAFKLAFQVPNLFRRLLGEGALTAAFIPIFKERERTVGEQAMWRAANAVISGLIIVTAMLIGIAALAVSLALALVNFKPETRLMLELLRVMLPYLLLVCLAAVFMGMLNARGHFFIPALGATMLNVVMIASVLLLAPRMGATLQTQIFGLAIGILIAGVAQAAFQLPVLRREGFRYRWTSPWPNETVKQVCQRMLPATIGVAAFQINVLTTYAFGFTVDKTIVASFDYAVRLMEFPQGIFGISLATYLLPTLAELAADRKFDEFRSTLAQGIVYLAFANLIASVLLLVLAEPIVRLIFEHNKFDLLATYQTANALACLAPGLMAFSLVNILARAFYALGDTQTPMKISVFCLLVNIIFAVPLVLTFRQGGLGIANTMSASFNVWLLFYALRRKLKRLDLGSVRRSCFVLCAVAVFAGETAYLVSNRWEKWFGHDGLALKIGAVFVPMMIASAVYAGLAMWLGIEPAGEIFRLIRDKLRKSQK